MDFLASPFGVMIILGIVAVAAFSFQPATFSGAWRAVAKRYETERRPVSVNFPDEEVSLNTYNVTRVDAAVHDDGLWMLFNRPTPGNPQACLLIPWDCIRFKEEQDNWHNFQIRLKDPLEFFASPELGAALQRRSQQMPTG